MLLFTVTNLPCVVGKSAGVCVSDSVPGKRRAKIEQRLKLFTSHKVKTFDLFELFLSHSFSYSLLMCKWKYAIISQCNDRFDFRIPYTTAALPLNTRFRQFAFYENSILPSRRSPHFASVLAQCLRPLCLLGDTNFKSKMRNKHMESRSFIRSTGWLLWPAHLANGSNECAHAKW